MLSSALFTSAGGAGGGNGGTGGDNSAMYNFLENEPVAWQFVGYILPYDVVSFCLLYLMRASRTTQQRLSIHTSTSDMHTNQERLLSDEEDGSFVVSPLPGHGHPQSQSQPHRSISTSKRTVSAEFEHHKLREHSATSEVSDTDTASTTDALKHTTRGSTERH